VRGIYGEGTCFLGDLYQVSNASCLGVAEAQSCQSIGQAIKTLMSREMSARETLFKGPNKLRTEDAVFRAYGTLRNALLLSYQEFMQHVSLVRMGTAMGRGFGLDFSAFNQLTLLAQPAHLRLKSSGPLSELERDALRAELVRKKIKRSP